MIGTLAWKEYREHRSVWIALAAAALLLNGSLFYFVEPVGFLRLGSDKQYLLATIFCVLAAVYGLVCGAMMLAGEVENGTLPFLDSLPSQRWLLWKTKFAVGVALVLAHAAILIALSLWLGIGTWGDGPVPAQYAAWCLLLLVLELFGYAWGLQVSAVCRHVLTAVSIAAPVGLFVSLLWTAMLSAALATDPAVAIGGEILLLLLLLANSAWIFCRVDRGRAGASSIVGKQESRDLLWTAAKSMAWLNWWQNRSAVLVMLLAPLLATLVFGATTLPMVVGLVGVFCGVLVLFPEQTTGTFRFIGDQRIAPGTFWAGKYFFWMLVALLACAPALVWGVVQAAIRRVHVPDESPFGAEVWYVGMSTLSLLCLVYGFCIGQFVSLAMRKTIVALVIAVPLTALVIAVWVPSLAMGGVHFWQVLVPPLFLLVASRLAMGAWVSGRLATLRPVMLLGGFAWLSAAWTAASLAYRVVEISDGGEPFDVRGYLASLPTPEDNEAGRLIHRAAADIGDLQQQEGSRNNLGRLAEIESRFDAEPLPPKVWTDADAEVGRWLEELFQRPSLTDLRILPELPMGLVVDPRRIEAFADMSSVAKIHTLQFLLGGRASQLQERGDHAGALDTLLIDLALARQFENHAVTAGNHEWAPLAGLDRWRQRGGDERVNLLRRALTALTRHEAERPAPADHVKAEYVVRRDSLGGPWRIAGPVSNTQAFHLRQLSIAHQTPWERERTLRMLNAVFFARLRAADSWTRQVPYSPFQMPPDLSRMLHDSPAWHELMSFSDLRAGVQGLYRVRLTRVRLALALYAAEHQGKPAVALEDLVPAYLAEVPINPFLGQAIRMEDVEAKPNGLPGPGGQGMPPVPVPPPGLGQPGAQPGALVPPPRSTTRTPTSSSEDIRRHDLSPTV